MWVHFSVAFVLHVFSNSSFLLFSRKRQQPDHTTIGARSVTLGTFMGPLSCALNRPALQAAAGHRLALRGLGIDAVWVVQGALTGRGSPFSHLLALQLLVGSSVSFDLQDTIPYLCLNCLFQTGTVHTRSLAASGACC